MADDTTNLDKVIRERDSLARRLAVRFEESERLRNERDMARFYINSTMALHGRSMFRAPSTSGQRGQYFCTECTTLMEDRTVYVPFPCNTRRSLAGELQDAAVKP